MPRTDRAAELHQKAVRDWSRAVLAFIMLVFVFALSISDGRIIPAFLTGGTASGPESIQAQEKPLAKGSIFIASPDSQTCKHRLIDNDTWRIREQGTILCDHTGSLSLQETDRNTGPSRIEAIRDSFFPRK